MFKRLLARTPVNELDVKETPVILFRTNPNTWIDAIVRYLVHPKQSGRVKTNMTKRMLERLNQRPDLVLFPKSNARKVPSTFLETTWGDIDPNHNNSAIGGWNLCCNGIHNVRFNTPKT